MASGQETVRVAPSDLTFLLRECIRCFWMKVKHGQRRPSAPMPKVFTTLDRSQRDFFDGARTAAISPALKPGVVVCSGTAVCSAPIEVPGRRVRFEFRGSLDAALIFDDGTFGIADFKTSEPRGPNIPMYWLQLSAYALAMERPANGRPARVPVDTLGLLCFEPQDMVLLDDGDVAYRATPTWIPVERNDHEFFQFLALVAEIVAWTSPPKARAGCPWCPVLSVPAASA